MISQMRQKIKCLKKEFSQKKNKTFNYNEKNKMKHDLTK